MPPAMSTLQQIEHLTYECSCFIKFIKQVGKKIKCEVGLPHGNIYVLAINVYKIGLPFKQTLAHDQRRGLLIAFSNEKYCLLFS